MLSTPRCSGSPCTRCVSSFSAREVASVGRLEPARLCRLRTVVRCASREMSLTAAPHVHEQFPAAWILLLFVGLLKFNISFLPIVMLALVFNVTNTVGYTYGAPLSRFPALERRVLTRVTRPSRSPVLSPLAAVRSLPRSRSRTWPSRALVRSSQLTLLTRRTATPSGGGRPAWRRRACSARWAALAGRCSVGSRRRRIASSSGEGMAWVYTHLPISLPRGEKSRGEEVGAESDRGALCKAHAGPARLLALE